MMSDRTSLTFTDDVEQNLDTLKNDNIIGKKIAEGLSSIQTFIGYFKTVNSIAGMYVDRYFDENALQNNLSLSADRDKIDVVMSRYTWHDIESTDVMRCTMKLSDHGYSEYSIADPVVRFSYFDDNLTFAILT